MGNEFGSGSERESADTPPSDAQQPQVAAPADGDQPRTGEPTDQTPPADVAGDAGAAVQTDAPPASEPGQMVPLKALEEERKGRQDWKEKAIRFEEELKHLRASQGQQQPSQQQQQPAPTTLTYERALERAHEHVGNDGSPAARRRRRRQGARGVPEGRAGKPALGAQLAQQRHPWQFMFDQAKRIQAMSEIGSDPAAYRQRLRDEILAELLQQQGAAPAAQAAAATAAPTAP